ncbi:hypothetical protein JHJ32_00580 [Parapedobacter sp. ISTM3]|uniref:STING domain-containing protein n=1 Tax=Parapedobacter sp. ISTM3 TaxID=2800130 RepID=UPI001903ECF8|nr:STING domain-containing protein [Parapedobacter sp. ISTM3]MBK1438467.1 hypothetical protein [Parapedobacter sp. ISTM3]
MKFGLKFLPVKDMFYSVIPTVGTYLEYLNGADNALFKNLWVSLGVGLVVSLALAILFYRENVKTFKKSLAEILAVGYFNHFSGRLGKLVKSKVPVDFSFPDNSLKTFTTDKINVEIGIPKNFSSLCSYANAVERKAEIVYVREASQSEPFWLRANIDNDSLLIYEYPRTLFSLPKYLKDDFGDSEKAEKSSVEVYAYFKQKINQLRIAYANEIADDRLHFIDV